MAWPRLMSRRQRLAAALGVLVLGLAAASSAVASFPVRAAAAVPSETHFFCSQTGDGAASFTVPSGGFNAYLVTVKGAAGTEADFDSAGGTGGEVTGVIEVTAGEVLHVTAGCQGGGSSGSGGVDGGGGGHGDGSGGDGGNGHGRGGAGGGGASSITAGSGSTAVRMVAGGGGSGGGVGYGFGGDVFNGGAGGAGGLHPGTGSAGQGTNLNGPLPGGSGGCGGCTHSPDGGDASAGDGIGEGGGGGGGGGCQGGSAGGPGDYQAGGGGGGGGSSCVSGPVDHVSYADGASHGAGGVTLTPTMQWTFGCTKAAQSVVVPAGPWSAARVEASGAQGYNTPLDAGLGGQVEATGPVTSGTSVAVAVGCHGSESPGESAFGAGAGGEGGQYTGAGGGGGTQVSTSAWSVTAGGGGGRGGEGNGTNYGLGGDGGEHPADGGAGFLASGGVGGSESGPDGGDGTGGSVAGDGGGGGGGCQGGGGGEVTGGGINDGGGGGGGGSSCVTGPLTSVSYGDGDQSGGGSVSLLLLSPAPATTSVAVSASSPQQDPVSNTTFTFTATVSSSAGVVSDGTVAFAEGSKVLAGCAAVPVVSGKATCRAALNHGGYYTVQGTYSGSQAFAPAQGSNTGYMYPTETTMSVTAIPTTVVDGGDVTLIATIKPTVGTRIPTGTIQFSDDYQPFGAPQPIDGNGEASLTAAIHGVGGHTLRAQYTQNEEFYDSVDAVGVTVVSQHAPTVTITTPTDGATYLRGQSVKAAYRCQAAPNGPGIKSCSGPVADGAAINTSTPGAHTFKVTATDTAGDTSSQTVTYAVADHLPPTVTVVNPTDGATYVRGQSVKAAYRCQSAPGGPGIKSCTGPVADGAAIDTSTLGGHAFKVTATDTAGESSSDTVGYTVADHPPPTVTIANPKNGATYARGQSVKAAYRCASPAGGRPVTSCTGPISDGAVIDTSALGPHTFEVTGADDAGITNAKTVGYTVAGAPAAHITAPADGQTFKVGQSVRAIFSCREGASGPGLRSCVDARGATSPGRVDTSKPGTFSYMVTATSKDGQSGRARISYRVTRPTTGAPPTSPPSSAPTSPPAHGTGRSCPKPSGRLTGLRLGPVRLGMTRAQARRAMPRFTVTDNRFDRFCLAGGKIRAAYPSRQLLQTLRGRQRRHLRGRIVVALTANPNYALNGVRSRTSLRQAKRRLRLGRRLVIGRNAWYLIRQRHRTAVLKLQHGIVREIGLADRALAATRQEQRRLLTMISFNPRQTATRGQARAETAATRSP